MPSWTSRPSATFCRTAIRCCWWTASWNWKPERIVGIKNVTANEPFFLGHFPDFPVMPGVLIVEAMAQVAGVLVLKQHPGPQQQAGAAGVRSNRPSSASRCVPGDQLRMEMKVDQAQGDRGQDVRHGHRGRRGGGRSRNDVQAGRPTPKPLRTPQADADSSDRDRRSRRARSRTPPRSVPTASSARMSRSARARA